LKKQKIISVFEYQNLRIGDFGFQEIHLNALMKLNELHNNAYFQPIAKGVRFNQYVGTIQVDGLTIEINPKADKTDEDNKWKGFLLHMLKSCGRLSPKSTGVANVNRQHLNLLEVYFELYLKEVEGLIRKGLIKQYRLETKNTKALKGKLEFAGHIQQNIIHKERFYTKHQVYDTDHFIHQVLNNAIEIVEQFSRGTRIYDLTKRIQLSFPEVKLEKITTQKLNAIKLNRKTSHYSYALELARLIILNYSPDISSGKEKMISLLFDMNELWEEFIYIQLKNYLSEINSEWKIEAQSRKSFIGFHYLKPDIVLTNKLTNEKVVIDTKWKLADKYVSIQDLRQVYTYGRYWGAEKVMLLYPGNSNNQNFRRFENINDPIAHKCKLGFVNVMDEHGHLSKIIGQKVFELLDF